MFYREHPTDAGMDAFAAEHTILQLGETKRVRTGICVELESTINDPEFNIPGGWTYAILVWDKSGLGSRGIKILGGVIDFNYRGEVQIIIQNQKFKGWFDNMVHYMKNPSSWIKTGAIIPAHPYSFAEGDKLCNILVQRVELPLIDAEPSSLGDTDRGDGGFGHTGQ